MGIIQGVSSSIVKLVAGIAILLLGLVIGRFLGKLIEKILHALEINRILQKEAGVRIKVEEFIGNIVKYLTYLIFLIIALNQIGLTTTVLYIILIVILVLIVAFIILTIKDFLPNIVAGIIINQRRLIKKGDKIKIRNIEGTVINISLTETKVKTKEKDIIFIPNSIITKSELTVRRK